MKKDNIKVSIAIPTYFRPKYLELLLSSIKKLNYDLSRVEVIVVRHPDDKEALQVINSFLKQNRGIEVKILDTPKDSVSVMRNIGIKSASSNIVILTDDDIVLNPNTIKRAIHFLREPGVVAVGFPALTPRPTLQEKLHHGRFLGIIARKVNTTMPVTAFKKDILIKYIGLYREDMGPPHTIHEDWELGSRIRSKGYEIIVDGLTPQIHKPFIGSKKDYLSKSKTKNSNKVKSILRLLTKVSIYISAYLNKNWQTLFIVLRNSPLSQKLEYMFYLSAPWIFIILFMVNISYALGYIVLIPTITIFYSFYKKYYKMFKLLERITYPIILLTIRIIRTNLAAMGYLKSIINKHYRIKIRLK